MTQKKQSITSENKKILCNTCKWKHIFGLCDHPLMMGGVEEQDDFDNFNLDKTECKWYEIKETK